MQTADKQPRGAVLFFTVLLIGTAMIIALASLSRAGIDTFVQADRQEQARLARAHILGCFDLLLIELQADSSFTSSTIATPYVTCSLVLTSPTSQTREAQLILTQGGITRGVFAELTVQPVTVTVMSETF